MKTAHVYTEQRQSEPVETIKANGSFRYALARFGFTGAQINRVLPDLDCGREVRIGTFTIQPV